MENFKTHAECVSATDKRVAQYDLVNGTELFRFVRAFRNISQGAYVPPEYYHIGNTGDLLNSLGIVGQITIGKYAINERRHSRSGHNLTVEDWLDALDVINNPIAVCIYCRVKRGYRIYLDKEKGEKVICLGIDVNSVGRNDVRGNASNEVLIYKRKLR